LTDPGSSYRLRSCSRHDARAVHRPAGVEPYEYIRLRRKNPPGSR
jgi:hypothetical protein